MSIPFGNEVVTLVRRAESKGEDNRTQVTYTVETLNNCSWRRTTRYNRESGVLVPYEGIVCRVPAGQLKPMPGDLLILGTASVTVTSGADYQGLIERFSEADGAFVVTSVADNARPGMPMPHFAARS